MKRMERHNLDLLEQIENENRYFLKWDYYTDSFNNKDSHNITYIETVKLNDNKMKITLKFKEFYSPLEIKYILYNYNEADGLVLSSDIIDDDELAFWLKNKEYLLDTGMLKNKKKFLHLFDESEKLNQILIKIKTSFELGLPYTFYYFEHEKDLKDKLVHEVKKRYGDLCTYRIDEPYTHKGDYVITFIKLKRRV
ncbi:hypothetical protein PCV68_000991 [Staphylococcus pseudintermedius]|nr:hypothetical protein [Staphylococcus pseudintermedius]